MYDKIFEEISKDGIELDTAKLSFVSSLFRMPNKYLVFSSLDEALKYKDKFSGLSDAQSAKCGNYITIRLDDLHRIIIENADHIAVRKKFLDDLTEYQVSVAFKLAEFHGYVHTTHLDTGINKAIGATVTPAGSLSGTWVIRNDKPYDEKYFFRDVYTNISPKLDKASIGAEFLVTGEKYLDAIIKIDEKHKSIPVDNQDFRFLGNNCHDFSHEFYTLLGLKGHEFDFIRAEHLDFHDRGVFYKYIIANPSMSDWIPIACKMIKGHPSVHIPTIIKKAISDDLLWGIPKKLLLGTFNLTKDVYNYLDWKYYYYCGSSTLEMANKQDDYGNNAIHKAILMEDLTAAEEYIKMGVSSNATNAKGETALHLAAGLPPSDAKQMLLEKLIGQALDINQPDLYADNIPLTFAALANDTAAIKLLVQHGANPHFISSTKESLGIITAEAGVVEAAQALYEIAPEIFYLDNKTRQIPIHHEKLQGALPITENAPPAKDYIEANNVIQDVLAHLSPLIEVLTPNVTIESV